MTAPTAGGSRGTAVGRRVRRREAGEPALELLGARLRGPEVARALLQLAQQVGQLLAPLLGQFVDKVGLIGGNRPTLIP